jgi:hypothetical protein
VEVDMASAFNGSSSRINGSESPAGTGFPVTMCGWVKTNSTGAGTIVGLSIGTSTGGNQEAIYLGRNGSTPRAGVRNSSGLSQIYSSGTLSIGVWTHLAFVVSSSSAGEFFINGSSAATGGSYAMSALNAISIGCLFSSNTNSLFWNGALAEIGVWAAALSASEIASLVNGFRPDQIRPQSLKFYAPLVRDIIDVRGGLALTATGTTVTTHPRIY